MSEYDGDSRADARERYRQLHEPIPADQLVTSLDVQPMQDEKDDRLRETEWLLRFGAG